MSGYRVLPAATYHYEGYELVPVRASDQESIRQWRSAQQDILRQNTPLTVAAQQADFQEVVAPLFDAEQPGQLLFSLLQAGELIGYGGLVHIDWAARRAEISFLLEPSRNAQLPVFQADFAAFLHLLRQVAFDGLPLLKLNTEAYAVRPYLSQVLEAVGFVAEAQLRHHACVRGQLVDTLFHSCFRPTAPFRGHVLVTSIASKVPLLRAVQAAAHRLHYATRVLGADLNPAALARQLATDFWELPVLTDAFVPELVAGCRARNIAYIIPTRDGELAFWSRHRATLAEVGIAVLVSEPAGVARCLDKVAFADFGQAHGLPVIATTTDLGQLDGEAFVVKERYGAGSQQVGLNLSRTQAELHARTLRQPIFQPFVAGREISVDAYVDLAGQVHGLVARTRDVVVRGESQVTTTLLDAALLTRLTGVVAQLGLYGPVVLQALLPADGSLHLLECNCRFGGASTLGIAAGVDSFYWFLQEASGADLARFPFRPAAAPLRQVRAAADTLQLA